jgi:hypothetical protein
MIVSAMSNDFRLEFTGLLTRLQMKKSIQEYLCERR